VPRSQRPIAAVVRSRSQDAAARLTPCPRDAQVLIHGLAAPEGRDISASPVPIPTIPILSYDYSDDRLSSQTTIPKQEQGLFCVSQNDHPFTFKEHLQHFGI